MGVVVMIHDGGKGFEVEFMTVTGETIAVVTLHDVEVRALTDRHVPHARALAG